MKWLYVVLAIIYTLFPYDLLPDFLAGIGWVDDLIVIGLLLRFLYLQLGRSFHANPSGSTEYRKTSMEGGKRAENNDKGSTNRFDSTDPYIVLGVEKSASDAHIKRAYRDLVGQYHPDKVAHLGDEFKKLARNDSSRFSKPIRKSNPNDTGNDTHGTQICYRENTW